MTISEEIESAQMMIENALKHARIQKKLESIGYLSSHIQTGKVLLEEVTLLHALQTEEYGAKFQTTQTLKADMEAVKNGYKKHRSLARIAFENDVAKQHVLNLNKPLPKNRTAWTSQVLTFYKSLLKDHKMMAQYGVSKSELEQAKVQAETLITTRNTQAQKKGDAQQATARRNEALKALRQWIRDFKTILKVALRGEEQLLEAVGMVTPAS